MAILKQENKIIRNLSGEILTEAIDTKILAVNPEKVMTGNLVNEIMSDPMPHKFKALAGQEPQITENYFDFTDTHTELKGKGFDYSKPFIMEISYNYTSGDNQRLYTQWKYPTYNTYYIRISASTDSSDHKYLSWEGIYSTYDVKYSQNLPTDGLPLAGLWNHNVFQYDGLYLSQFVNGYLYRIMEITYDGVYMGSAVFGSNEGYTPYQYKGLSGGFCVSTKIQERFNGWDKANDVVKYSIGVQAFVPPTIPNTIL